MLKRTLALSSFLVACHSVPDVITVAPPTDLPRPGQMTVTATATLDVSPDCADLSMTIATDNLKPGLATESVDAKERTLIATLTNLGIDKSDIKLSLVNLAPIYEPNPSGWEQIKIHTYRAQISLTATTRDFGKVSAIIEAGSDAGATSMSSQFRRSDLASLKKQVRDMALGAAKDKANQTATALGIKLGRIVAVSENTANGYMWNNAYFPQANAQSQTAGASAAIGGTLQPLTLDVTIGYELGREL